MRWTKGIIGEAFWGFAIIAIVLLAPSSGLITLTIPDEPYGSAIGLPDTPHIGKRASEDSDHFAFDATFTTYDIHPKLFMFDDIMPARESDPHAALVSPDQIRAPPDTATV
jgi:hypothetical protein